MKLTNKQLKLIIKEELNNVLEEMFDYGPTIPRVTDQHHRYFPDQVTDEKGSQHYQALAGTRVESILNDPNIPEDHKQKLATLFQQGPEGRKQALELMDALGYEGVETSFSTEKGPHEEIRNPFRDAPSVHNIDPNSIGDIYEE